MSVCLSVIINPQQAKNKKHVTKLVLLHVFFIFGHCNFNRFNAEAAAIRLLVKSQSGKCFYPKSLYACNVVFGLPGLRFYPEKRLS
jgi:hypothetical protein